MRNWARTRARTRRGVAFGAFRMKPMNVIPMVILLIAILLIVYWLRPH
jgi:hypothetical protein